MAQQPASPQRPVISDRYLAYLVAFVVLVFLLYVLPEALVFKQYGFAPVEHLADTEANPTLSAILKGLWQDRAQILNPMNNSLVRFFIVTMVVGVVFDGMKRHSPFTRDRSN